MILKFFAYFGKLENITDLAMICLQVSWKNGYFQIFSVKDRF